MRGGGHCLPKDTWLLKWGVDSFGKKAVEPMVLTGSRFINDHMPNHTVDLVRDAFNDMEMPVKGRKVCILGIAFLQNSDDTRNTPSLPVYEKLVELGADVIVHDVHVKEFEGVSLTNDLNDAVRDADCIVLMTAHKEYFDLTPEYYKGLMRTPMIVDGRNVYSIEEYRNAGFEIRGVGKGK